MAVTYTPEQQKVIELRDRNILVSAAAGSGKTAVLVERIVRMITEGEEPLDVDRLLVVTFTNAAAAEMKERISQAIGQRLLSEPENVHLQKQSSLLHNAQITTIDSFCLFVIRNNFNDIGLDPGFRVADEGELKLLKQDVLSELLEEKYRQKDQDFLNCVEYFTGGSDDKLLEEYIEKLYEFAMSCPWPEDWISQCAEDYKISNAIDMENREWCRFLVGYMQTIAASCAAKLEQAVGIAQRPDGPYMYGELLEQEWEMLQKFSEAGSLSEFYQGIQNISFGRLSSKKDETVNPLCREKVQQLRKEVKKQMEELREDFLLLSPDQAAERMKAASPCVGQLLSLVLSYKKLLDERKRKENIIDFHDMEHFALDILLSRDQEGTPVPTPSAREYRQYFAEILIDEYQDSNLVQELLLSSISGEEEQRFNRFMVGDVKQSIYKFRLARPELFIEKYNCYSKEDSCCQRIDLHKNFRSRPQVLDSVNLLFEGIMGKELGGVEYDQEAALYPGAEFLEPDRQSPYSRDGQSPYSTEYFIIGKDEQSTLTVREQEAQVIARRIRQLHGSFLITDKATGELRPVDYRDIVILLRTNAGWAEEFRRILEQEGIPAYVTSRTGYFQATEVRVLLDLLHVLDNPLQDIPLYGVMKSFFGGFSQEEIASLRAKDKRKSLYRVLQECEEEKVQDFLHMLKAYRQKVAYTPIHVLIREILTDTGYLDYVTARPGGEQRRANVEMLLTRAAAFESTSYYGLFHFLRYIEQLEKYEVDYGEADVLDENADVVRLMSIHKSKGLEFPVCFVAGLAKRFNFQDTTGRLIADVDMGVGADYVDSHMRVQSRTLKKNAVALKLRLDALGEEMRILYVAMTRAREKLILTAMTSDLEKFSQDWEARKEFGAGQDGSGSSKVSFAQLAASSSCLDFLLERLPGLCEVQLIHPQENVVKEMQETFQQLKRRQKLLVEASKGLSNEDNSIVTYLSKRFARQYKYGYLSDLFVKTTVSELKKKGLHDLPNQSIEQLADSMDREQGVGTDSAFTRQMFEEEEVVPYIPSFIRKQEGLSGTDRGSAYHKVMELLDFTALCPEEGSLGRREICSELERQLDKLEQEEILSSAWRQGVSSNKLAAFFENRLAYRMARALEKGKLKREQPFVLGFEANRLDERFPDSEQVLIQGIIDVFFEEDGEIIVADYKTDAVKAPEELIKRYQIQLDYYGEALERLTGKKVKQKIIYSFALNKEIMV